MNEHICATALYYLESENVTPSDLSSRLTTSSNPKNQEPWNRTAPEDNNWLNAAYGADFQEGKCIQNYGKVQTRAGRLLAFPNNL